MKRIKAVLIVLILSSQLFAITDYNSLHNILIKFYGYQRAGLASGSCYNLNSGFTNASHGGDAYNSSPLDGGWYDAGDYIKFGMNLGYAVYCLEKGYDVFPSGYANNTDWKYNGTDAIPDVLNEIKFATDYMLKAVINETTVVLDVGKAEEEHATWGVTNASGRTGGKIVLCTGADIPLTYSACLALMSTLYRKYDAAYADKCVEKAKVAFSFGKAKIASNSLYSTPQLKAGAALYDYPKDEGAYTRQINDRMVAAGVELYRATKDAKDPDPTYKAYAKQSISDFSNCIGYASIGPLAAFEVWRQGLGGNGCLSMNVGFISGKIKTSGFFNKVYQNSGWGTARDVGSAAFEFALAYVTNSNETDRTLYKQRVKDHIDWVTGTNSKSQSYVCGVGSGPTKIHYRSTNYGPVPGGVVSGPDGDGNWTGDGSANFTEVAVDYNAGLIGAVAFMKAISNPPADGDVGMTAAFAATPKTNIDFTKSSVTFSATFSKSVAYTIKISGAFGTKTISKTGTTISEVWDGSADKGAFIGGESVAASLSVDGNIVAYDLVKASGLEIVILRNKKSAAKPGDVLVNNFDDNNLTNKVGGTWAVFGTGAGLKKTTSTLSADSGSIAFVMNGTVVTNTNKNWAGIKTTFKEGGAACNVGPIKSIYFDLRADKSANVSVELEQSSIADGAYYSAVVPVTNVGNKYRVNIADFKQPDWKTTAKDLELSSISALRFTVYDSTNIINLYVDNVYIEDLSIGTSATKGTAKLSNSVFKPVVSNGAIFYSIPQTIVGTLDIAVYNIAGKNILKRSFNTKSANTISVPLSSLPAGMYTVVNSVSGKIVGEKFKFVHTN